MGYMGFGMKKEVYTRKPKKAFNKLKQVYGQSVAIPKSTINGKKPKKYLVRNRFKHFSQTVVGKILKFLVLGSIVGLFIGYSVWEMFLKEPYFNFRRSQFEKRELASLISNKFGRLETASVYFINRGDKISDLFIYASDSNRFNITIKHFYQMEKITKDSVSYMSSDCYFYCPDFEIIGSSLIYKGELAKNRWQLSFDNINPDKVPFSFYEYLETNKEEFRQVIDSIDEIHNEINVGSFYISTIYNHNKFGRYRIYISKANLDNDLSKLKRKSGKVSDGVYWVRL